MYEDYMNVIYEIEQNYNGELDEKELTEIEYHNQHYETIKNKIAEEMAGGFVDDIIDNLFN